MGEAEEWFGGDAKFECERMELGRVGDSALENRKHKIKELKVGEIGVNFGRNATIYDEKIEIKKGTFSGKIIKWN